MSTDSNPELASLEPQQLLPAFADGELNDEQSLRVLESMANNPAQTKQVFQHKQLKQACGRAMSAPQMRCPDELRAKLTAMLPAEADTAVESTRGDQPEPVLARIGRWVAPVAAAAALFFAALVSLNFVNTGHKYTSDGILTASLAQTLGNRHMKCALGEQAPDQLELFPASVDQLDKSLIQHVGQEVEGAALDLSVLGYDYQLAGLCPIPGGKAVHVIYENDNDQSLSLWIKAYDQKPVLDAGVPYIPPQDHTTQPMMVWREGDMVFYLVGDTMDDVRRAQPAIKLAMAS